jgi:hypothetical protein
MEAGVVQLDNDSVEAAWRLTTSQNLHVGTELIDCYERAVLLQHARVVDTSNITTFTKSDYGHLLKIRLLTNSIG